MPQVRLPPGPKGHFIAGNLVEFSEDPLGFLTRCAREYGDVVRLGKRNFLLNDPDLIEKVLVNGDGNFVKLAGVGQGQRHRGGFPEAMMNSEGEDWLRKRRLVQPAFHRKHVAACGDTVVSLTEQMLQTWRPGDARDVHAEVSALALGIVSRFLFHTPIDDEARHVADAVDAVMRHTDSPLRPPMWVPTPTNLRLRRALDRLDTLLTTLLRRYREHPESRTDLLALLLSSPVPLSEAQLRDELATMILSGHETTADALVWAWYLLAQHPEAEARLREELDTVLGGRLPGAEDLPRLSFTEAVVKEAMRLYSPAWITSREALRDCELGGFHVPAGTTLAVSQWVTHRDPRYFDAPDAFRPERWLSEDATRRHKYVYFPFGGGPRFCIGAALAMMETVLITACVARRYRLELAPGCVVRPRPALALQPLGVRLIPHPRAARGLESEARHAARA
ncbi:Cytochrome P450 family protein [Myxococcus hansupus]|uniref:Cytochrome P450 family protein n=1 Tax=Pseudomyxococcus hansupus TaxID=1297742 RepID=A0A0H4X677_9BACT|nr:cytochrome P450 [Myxococcus hansupus]AKQ69408.1 Cytochrome P450 family protein [Myxococcus hansupus]